MKPKYRRVEKLPYVPSEKDIDQLMEGLSKRLGTIVLFLKETGARKGEIWNVNWVDLRSDKNCVFINSPEKNSKPRIVRIIPRLVSLINQLPRTCDYTFRKNNDASQNAILSYFWQKRKETTEKVNNPNLNLINFKSLRHFKATKEYHQTKDILHVKELLGHRNIKNTLVYVHITKFGGDDNYIVKVAESIENFTELLSKDYGYVTDYEGGLKVLRKRK